MEEDKTFLMSKGSMQKILDYLGQRPFAEVHQLIPTFYNLKEGIEKPKDEEKAE